MIVKRAPLVSLVACAACAKNPTITFAELDGALLDAKCERLARCGAFADEASCKAWFRPRPDLDLAAAVDTGKIRFDGELAKLCVDTLAAQSCDATARAVRLAPQTCEGMFVGTLDADARCEFDRECRSNRCVPDEPCQVGACCSGKCDANGAKAVIGEACEVNEDCTDDTYCNIDDHMCRALELEGAKCLVDAQCDYGLACDRATFPGTCVVAAATGEACPEERCAELGAYCSDAGTCIALGLPGAPCTDAAQCSPFMRCDTAAAKCAALPQLGATCDDGVCAGESWCDTTMNPKTCRAPLPKMEMCTADNQCASRYCHEGPVFDFCDDLPVCT